MRFFKDCSQRRYWTFYEAVILNAKSSTPILVPIVDLKLFKNMNVLCVEDDLVQAHFFEKNLGRFFNRTYLAASGARALEIMEHLPIHLVFLDIRLPDVDGLTVAARIRAKDPDIPMVIVTAHQDVSDLRRAASLFLTDYLVKPVSMEALRAVLKKCLDQLNLRGRVTIDLGNGTSYDTAGQYITFSDGRHIFLNRRESSFLDLLMKRPGNIVSIDRIEEVVFDDSMSLAALRNMVLRLRKKLGPAHRIQCVRDIGYTWLPPADS